MKKLITCLLFVMILSNITCKKSTDPVVSLCSPFTDITETDEVGQVIGNTDTDDWQNSGVLRSLYAYPNPCNPVCTIKFNLTEMAVIKITVNNKPERIISNLWVDTLNVGYYSISWNAMNDSGEILPDCIYRVCFSATTNAGVTYKTYGDIEIKH